MKIRKGFVSNSSSSSFVVVFPKTPNSIEDVKKIMFGDMETHEGYKTIDIAKRIFNDITSQLNEGEIKFNKKVIDCIEVYGDPDLIIEKFYPEITKDESLYWDIHDKITTMQEGDQYVINEFKKKYPKCKIFNFTFSDDCGDWESMLEHSDIFHNLPHDIDSHH